jgi:hypothetical protein
MYQGAKWILLKQKKRSRKSHAWAPLKRKLLKALIFRNAKTINF